MPLIEDAAESLGSWIGNRHTGTLGKMGVLSFNGNKIITTGGGGAILTNDAETARRLKHLTTTAKQPHRWEFVHDEVAYNYRLPNLNAALGCAQLERLPDMLQRKRELANAYAQAFANTPDFRFITEPKGCSSNYWLNAVFLSPVLGERRDEFLGAAHEAAYQCRPVWRLLHRLAMYADCSRTGLSVAESIERRIINLPSSPQLNVGPQ
jgi:perosamine synthetase